MKLKYVFSISLLFFIYFIFNSFSFSYSVSNDLEKNIFRLRVIANSDSKADQELKLEVRNNILEYLNQFDFSNKEETVLHLKNNKSDIEKIISSTITKNGFDYSYEYEISNSFYPEKKYHDITLPSGNYDGLQIKLGNGNGQNWWCILFPPMCLIDSSTCKINENSNEILSTDLSNETINIIQSEEFQYKFKFKIVDMLNNL